MRRIVVALALTAAVVTAGAARQGEEPQVAEAHHEQVQKRSERGDGATRLRPGCSRHFRMRTFYRYTKRRYARRTAPLTEGQKTHIKHLALCLANREKSDWAYAKKRKWRKAFRQRNYWRFAFQRMPSYEQSWAWSTGACESGNNPRTNTGNGFYGAFQFMAETAWSAGFKVLPHLTSWYEQAVRAIRWKWRTSDEQWPVCGD